MNGMNSVAVDWIERITARMSLAKAALLIIGLTVLLGQALFVTQDLASADADIADTAGKRADAALNMLEAVHTQAMTNRLMVEDGDSAIATLNGTMDQFSAQSEDVKLWVVMGDKIVAFQNRQGADELELPRDAIDRRTLESGEGQTELVGNVLRRTRAIKLGHGSAKMEACAGCHEKLMGIARGEVMGAYSAEVDLAPEQAAWWAQAKDETLRSLIYAAVTIMVLMLVLKAAAFRPLERITQAMTRLGEGDKGVAIPGRDCDNEIGRMARALEVFRDNAIEVERLQGEAAEAARAELDRQAAEMARQEEERSQKAQMLHDLSERFDKSVGEVVSGVAAAASQLQATASAMAASAEQSTVQTQTISFALDEASGGVTAAASASDEFALSIDEISRQAANAADVARRASQAAAHADDRVAALADAAGQVGKIVELISSIAQRTNLLALNASIEAARNGEAGRGFAVVASEVKELAAQTSRATEEIALQIKAMQDTTTDSVEALRAIAGQIETLEVTSVSIASAVDQQSIAGRELARSIDLAANGTRDVSANVGQVRDVSVQTGAAASQVLSSSNELEQQARALRSQAENFLQHIRAA